MATFNSLPLFIHSQILNYVITPLKPPYSFNTLPVYLEAKDYKRLFYDNVWDYQSLNHTWRYMIQAKLWRYIVMKPFDASQLLGFLAANPVLSSHIRILDFSSCACDSSPFKGIIKIPTPPNIPFNETSGDTRGGLIICQAWAELIELVENHLRHGGLERIVFGTACYFQGSCGTRIVQFPKGYKIPVLKENRIKSFRLVRMYERGGDVLGGDSIRMMVECLAAGLEELRLGLTSWGIGERQIRRATYLAITKLSTTLLHLSPNLTTLYLDYANHIPPDVSDTHIYSYTQLDNYEDLLSRALRILSKKLVNFTYLYGRISPELFAPSTTTTTESPQWPYLKRYIVKFSPITSDGRWGYNFKDTDAMGHSSFHTEPLDGMFAKDPNYVDLVGSNNQGRRMFPDRAVIDRLFETASRTMAPNMPVIEYWQLTSASPTGCSWIWLRYDYYIKRGGTLTRGKEYAHTKETMSAWHECLGECVMKKEWSTVNWDRDSLQMENVDIEDQIEHRRLWP